MYALSTPKAPTSSSATSTPGAAPPSPPLPDVVVVRPHRYGLHLMTAIVSAVAGAAAVLLLN